MTIAAARRALQKKPGQGRKKAGWVVAVREPEMPRCCPRFVSIQTKVFPRNRLLMVLEQVALPALQCGNIYVQVPAV
jgi:hypothetical protein